MREGAGWEQCLAWRVTGECRGRVGVTSVGLRLTQARAGTTSGNEYLGSIPPPRSVRDEWWMADDARLAGGQRRRENACATNQRDCNIGASRRCT